MDKKFRPLLFLCLLVSLVFASIKDSDDLLYSTYLGGSSLDDGYGIAVDKDRNFYVVGIDYTDIRGFVAKFSPDNVLVYSVYLEDVVSSIVLDENGNIYVARGAGHVFVAKLNPDGEVIYSGWFGGSGVDYANGIAVDKDGNIYIAGYTASPDFPVTVGSYDTVLNGHNDAFVVKLSPNFEIIYSTYLGGSNDDSGYAIAVDKQGNAYIRGMTDSSDFPTTLGAFDNSYNGLGDIFITKLNLEGTQLIYSTYLGGNSSEWGYGDMALDDEGCVYVCDTTQSLDYPTTPGAYQPSKVFNSEACITKLNSDGTGLVFSTYLGGSDYDLCFAITIDKDKNVYVKGHTGGFLYFNDFPITPWAYDTSWNGEADIFVSILDSSGSYLIYSTFLGGSEYDYARMGKTIVVDDNGDIYITGMTESQDFPVTPDAFDISFNGREDVYVVKLKVPRANLTISSGSGGTTNPVPSTYIHLKGMPVQIIAIPQQGYRFTQWTGDATGTTNPITITLDTDKFITANFIRTYTLTIKTGTGGITNPGPGIYGHDEGEQVSIRAIPNQGYEFANWSGDASGTNSSITITMNSDKIITANFKKIPDKPTCFLSSIFGSSSKEAETFRNFRDRHLMSSSMGRTLVSSYYRVSPFLAKIVSKNRILRATTRITFTPVVKLVSFL